MGHHPVTVPWITRDGQEILRPNSRLEGMRFTDEQCVFVNDNVGVSRRTLKDVATMFNKTFAMNISYENFLELRADAIASGRCKTTYFRNYFKGENSSERELRRQKTVLKSRMTGGCQYQASHDEMACGAATNGRYCEAHVRSGYQHSHGASRGADYIDSSLGKYG